MCLLCFESDRIIQNVQRWSPADLWGSTVLDVLSSGSATKKGKIKEVRKLPPCLTSFWPAQLDSVLLCVFRNFSTPFQNQTSEMHWSWAEHKTVFPVCLKSRRLKEQYFHTTVYCLVVQSASTAGQWLNPTAAVESSAIWSTGPRWERYFLTNCFFSLLWFICGCTPLLTLDYSAGLFVFGQGVNILPWGEAMEAGIFECDKEDDAVDVESFQGMCAFSKLLNILYKHMFQLNQSVHNDLYCIMHLSSQIFKSIYY